MTKCWPRSLSAWQRPKRQLETGARQKRELATRTVEKMYRIRRAVNCHELCHQLRWRANLPRRRGAAVSWRARVVLVAVLCALPAHVKAAEEQGFLDGNKLFALCKEGGSITNQRVCLGYLMGVADVGQQLDKGRLCMPTGVGV